jgi:hypothetical protein
MNIEECFKNKELSKSSLDMYLSKLTKLNDNKKIKNLNFLKSPETVLKKISIFKPNTQRTYIISICSLLKCLNDKKNKTIYETYSKLLEKFNMELKDQTAKTETETNNWITQDEIAAKFEELKQLAQDNPTKSNIFNLLVLSLYHLIAPRRNKDFQFMKVIKNSDTDMTDQFNYINIDNQQFIFNNYKTAKTYKTQTENIPDELFEILKAYIKIFELEDDDMLLISPKTLKPYESNNAITLILNKIFKKNVSSSMLRKSYLTSKYSNKNKALEEDAKAMGTSVNTANNNYIKR